MKFPYSAVFPESGHPIGCYAPRLEKICTAKLVEGLHKKVKAGGNAVLKIRLGF